MNNLFINYDMSNQKKLQDDVLKQRNIEGLKIKEYHNGNIMKESNLEDIYNKKKKFIMGTGAEHSGKGVYNTQFDKMNLDLEWIKKSDMIELKCKKINDEGSNFFENYYNKLKKQNYININSFGPNRFYNLHLNPQNNVIENYNNGKSRIGIDDNQIIKDKFIKCYK